MEAITNGVTVDHLGRNGWSMTFDLLLNSITIHSCVMTKFELTKKPRKSF